MYTWVQVVAGFNKCFNNQSTSGLNMPRSSIRRWHASLCTKRQPLWRLFRDLQNLQGNSSSARAHRQPLQGLFWSLVSINGECSSTHASSATTPDSVSESRNWKRLRGPLVKLCSIATILEAVSESTLP